MNPEKQRAREERRRFYSTRQSTADPSLYSIYENVDANGDTYTERSMSEADLTFSRQTTPGAFRVGTDAPSVGDNYTAGDESGIILIPRADLVNHREKEEKMKKNEPVDLEAPSVSAKSIPIVHAERHDDKFESASPPRSPKTGKSRKFRICMLILCLTFVGLLGGVLLNLMKDDGASSKNFNREDDFIPFDDDRPPPQSDNDRSNGGGGGNGGGRGGGR